MKPEHLIVFILTILALVAFGEMVLGATTP